MRKEGKDAERSRVGQKGREEDSKRNQRGQIRIGGYTRVLDAKQGLGRMQGGDGEDAGRAKDMRIWLEL